MLSRLATITGKDTRLYKKDKMKLHKILILCAWTSVYIDMYQTLSACTETYKCLGDIVGSVTINV